MIQDYIYSNGKTDGITLPDASAQANVIRKAYSLAHISPRDTSYVEVRGGIAILLQD